MFNLTKNHKKKELSENHKTMYFIDKTDRFNDMCKNKVKKPTNLHQSVLLSTTTNSPLKLFLFSKKHAH